MATITITSTTASSDTSSSAYQSSLDDLSIILVKYRDWKDVLSSQIHSWGASSFLWDGGEPTPEELRMSVIKVDQLRTKILVNPLDQSPLKAPLLDGAWTWEKWMLDDYEVCCKEINTQFLSPFDNGLIRAEEHTFAKETLKWLNSLTISSSSSALITPIGHRLDQSLVIGAKDYASKWVEYKRMAKEAISRINLESLNQWTSHKAAELEVRQKEIEEKLAVETEKLKFQAEEAARILNEKLERLDTTHRNDTATLREHLQENSNQLEVERARLKKTGKELEEERGKRIALEIAARNMQQAIYNLERRQKKQENSCTIL